MSFARNAVFRARREAHAAFDPIWLQGHMSRVQAYVWLASAMGMPVEECHFSLFDIGLCEAAALLSRRKLRELKKARKREQKASRQGQNGIAKRRMRS